MGVEAGRDQHPGGRQSSTRGRAPRPPRPQDVAGGAGGSGKLMGAPAVVPARLLGAPVPGYSGHSWNGAQRARGRRRRCPGCRSRGGRRSPRPAPARPGRRRGGGHRHVVEQAKPMAWLRRAWWPGGARRRTRCRPRPGRGPRWRPGRRRRPASPPPRTRAPHRCRRRGSRRRDAQKTSIRSTKGGCTRSSSARVAGGCEVDEGLVEARRRRRPRRAAWRRSGRSGWPAPVSWRARGVGRRTAPPWCDHGPPAPPPALRPPYPRGSCPPTVPPRRVPTPGPRARDRHCAEVLHGEGSPLRVGPWQGDCVASVARSTAGCPARSPTCLGGLRLQDRLTRVTAAPPPRPGRLLTAGFWRSTSASTCSPRPPRRLRLPAAGERRCAGHPSTADRRPPVDHCAFEPFWRLDETGLADAVHARRAPGSGRGRRHLVGATAGAGAATT